MSEISQVSSLSNKIYRIILSCIFLSISSYASSLPPSPPQAVPQPSAGTFAPQLSTWNGGFAASWWQSHENKSHSLWVAVQDSGVWRAPVKIIQSANLFANWADVPSLGISDDFWAIHWLEKSSDATYAYHVQVAISEDQGRSWKNIGRLHKDSSNGEHGFVSYAKTKNGLRAHWLDGAKTVEGGPMNLNTAEISKAGISSEQVIDSRVCDCCWTASLEFDGKTVVAYRNRSESEIRDIGVQVMDENGKILSRQTLSDGWEIKGCPVNGPAISKNGDNVALLWYTQAAGKPRIRFSSAGKDLVFSPPSDISSDLRGKPLGRVSLVKAGHKYLATWLDETNWMGRFIGKDSSLLQVISIGKLNSSRKAGIPRIAVNEQEEALIAWTELSSSGDESSTQVKFLNSPVFDLGSKIPGWKIPDHDLASPSTQSLKSWQVTDINGKSVNPMPGISQPDALPVVISFWALWCDACLEKLPELDSYWEKQSPKARLLFVNLDDLEKFSAAKKWLEDNMPNIDSSQIVFDHSGQSYQLFGINTLPAMEFIDMTKGEGAGQRSHLKAEDMQSWRKWVGKKLQRSAL